MEARDLINHLTKPREVGAVQVWYLGSFFISRSAASVSGLLCISLILGICGYLLPKETSWKDLSGLGGNGCLFTSFRRILARHVSIHTKAKNARKNACKARRN